MDKLLKAFEQESTSLRSADIGLNGEVHPIYYRLMSGANHIRALELSKKTKTIKEADGTAVEMTYYDDDLLRSHIIYFQLLDKEGKRVFTNITEVQWIKDNISFETSSYLASIMGLKSVSDIVEEQKEALKKISG